MISVCPASTGSTGGLQCLQRLIIHLQHTSTTARQFSSLPQQQPQECSSACGLSLSDLPPHIILIRHGEVSPLYLIPLLSNGRTICLT